MSWIFKVAFKKGKKHLLKIDVGEGDPKWMNTTETVYNFAHENYEEGNEIGVDYEKKGNVFHVIRINKDGAVNEKKLSDEEDVKEETTAKKDTKKSDKFVCEDCGKEMTNGNYKKCYDCNQKNYGGKYSKKSPETQASIKMQTAYKCACMAIQVMTGQLDLSTLKEQIDDIAEHIVAKF